MTKPESSIGLAPKVEIPEPSVFRVEDAATLYPTVTFPEPVEGQTHWKLEFAPFSDGQAVGCIPIIKSSIDLDERPKARIVKVGREVPHPYDDSRTVFTGFEFDGVDASATGLEYDKNGELIYIGGYTPDELRQIIAEKPAEPEECYECQVDTAYLSVTPCEKHQGMTELERAVIEAAVKYREIFKWADGVPLSEYIKRSAEASDIKRDFNRATDALLKARGK